MVFSFQFSPVYLGVTVTRWAWPAFKILDLIISALARFLASIYTLFGVSHSNFSHWFCGTCMLFWCQIVKYRGELVGSIFSAIVVQFVPAVISSVPFRFYISIELLAFEH